MKRHKNQYTQIAIVVEQTLTRIQEAFAQGAKSVIIDARKTEMTLEEAAKVIERILGIYNDELPGTIEIWTIEGILRR